MIRKFSFFDEYGMEESDIDDPITNCLDVNQRGQAPFRRIDDAVNFVSPRPGIRFDLSTRPEMAVYRPDGRRLRREAGTRRIHVRVHLACLRHHFSRARRGKTPCQPG